MIREVVRRVRKRGVSAETARVTEWVCGTVSRGDAGVLGGLEGEVLEWSRGRERGLLCLLLRRCGWVRGKREGRRSVRPLLCGLATTTTVVVHVGGEWSGCGYSGTGN